MAPLRSSNALFPPLPRCRLGSCTVRWSRRTDGYSRADGAATGALARATSSGSCGRARYKVTARSRHTKQSRARILTLTRAPHCPTPPLQVLLHTAGSSPDDVALTTRYFSSAVACGSLHTVVLTRDGSVFTFGCGRSGQLGHRGAHEESQAAPRRLEGVDSPVVGITAGEDHTVLITAAGAALSFGRNHHGQLGHRDRKLRHWPTLMQFRGPHQLL